jgi:immune inhibitor A
MGGARRGPRHERVQLGRTHWAVVGLVLLALALAACSDSDSATPTPTAVPPTPTPLATTVTEIPDAPDRDSYELVRRYKGVTAPPLTNDQLFPDDEVGDARSFWVLTMSDPSFRRVDTDLRHVSEHALWYVATDNEVTDAAVERAARAFEEVVYEQTLDTFTGGVGPWGRISVVSASVPGLAGYFSSADTFPSEVYPFSNERSLVYMNSGAGVGSASYTGTLAHEFQHLVHAIADSNESTWLNEGLSELAAGLLGLPTIPFSAYLRDPEVSVVDWPENPNEALPYYAGSSLFAAYLTHRVGKENLRHLVAQPLDGVAGVDAFLDDVLPGVSFEEIYSDWLVANIVAADTGRYAYDSLSSPAVVNRKLDAPGTIEGTVNQLGSWYLNIETDSPLEVWFEGPTTSPILAERPHSGDACWWSNRGANIDSTITRAFDLTKLDRATLTYWSWYEIEEHWDHGYVAVSTNNGLSWQALEGGLSSSDDPVGTTVGPSYTGSSGGWREDSVDLSPFAGLRVLVRFEYLTDDAINSTGWCVDDIEVAEAGFIDDAESDGDWAVDGFVRITADAVPQRFILNLVGGEGDDATVTLIELDSSNKASFVVTEDSVLLVTAVAPKTTQPATFTLTAR